MFIDVWQWTPMVVLILLAGLTSLSEEPQEAARIDGATRAGSGSGTSPCRCSCRRSIVAVLLRGIDALKTFDILYATKGKRRRLVPRGRDAQRLRLRPELRLQRVRRLLSRPHHLLPHHHRARCGPSPPAGRRRMPMTRPHPPYQTFRVVALVLRRARPCWRRWSGWSPRRSRPTSTSTTPSKALVFSPTWDNYAKVLQQANYVQFIVEQPVGGVRRDRAVDR